MAEEDKIKLTADLIYGFTNALLSPKFDNAVATPDFHLELWDYMCSDELLVAAAAPRGHAKSTAITLAFAAANICFRQSSFMIIISDTESQSVNFLGDLKSEFLENEGLRELFGIDRLIKDRETDFILRFHDGHVVRVVAKGSMQALRGLKWRNRRPDMIIGDDLENDEIVMNEERRRKFKHWFQAALMPMGSKTCKIRIVGTILHLDSLLENLMPELGAKTTMVDGLRQTSEVRRAGWKAIRYRAHNEDFTEILWPEQYDEAYFKKKRQGFIDLGFPEGYAQEYLNYPIDESTAYFKKNDFKSVDEDSAPEEYYIAADLAISQKDTAAFSVFAVCGMTPDGVLRVRDIIRFRGDSLDIIDTVFRLHQRYKPEIFFIEQENIARTLGPILNKEMEERGMYPRIEGMTASQDKIKRARGLQARMRAGMVEFDTTAEWFPELQQELLHFPRGKYMDQVDALSWVALGLDLTYAAPTVEEIVEQEYQEEFGEDDYFTLGASGVTGY
tara:strand:- start:4595 stop:6103 length:1509 start_codon:yes stop_codon:yes gene_type:complete